MRIGIVSVLSLMIVAFGGIVVGCSDDGDGEGLEAHAFDIALEPPGHIHAFADASLTFTVMDEHGAAVAGLQPVVARQLVGDDAVRETDPEDIVDNADGSYTWERSFGDVGAYVLTLKFEEHGITYSNAFPIEVSKAGGERIFCPDADAPDHNYQIRWEASPGHVHGGDEVTFSIEVKRSINDDVNSEQPWQNRFDHLAPSDLLQPVQVMIGSDEGEEAAEVTYRGMGIYQVVHSFPSVHDETMYWLHVTFEDDCGVIDESGAEEHDYQFHVVPTH